MNQPRHLTAEFRFDRDNKTPVANGDNGVLQITLVARRTNHFIQMVTRTHLKIFNFPPDAEQSVACGIVNFILGENDRKNTLFNLTARRQHFKKTVQRGGIRIRLRFPIKQHTCLPQNCSD